MRSRVLSLLLILLLSPALLHAADPATFTVGAFTFKRPPNWSWVLPPPGSVRKAQLKIADPTNPTAPGAEVAFFSFGPGQGGGVEQNIGRWIGQFDHPENLKPIEENATIKGTKVTRVRVANGTFSSGMPGGPTTPMENYGLYGAILESPQGDVFVKLTGPSTLVDAAAANFEALIQSPF